MKYLILLSLLMLCFIISCDDEPEEKTTSTITYNIAEGWNMISYPGIESANPRDVFSFTPVDVFDYNSLTRRYDAVDSISVGSGFWIYSPSDTIITREFICSDSLHIELYAGWNLIGVSDFVVDHSAFDTLPGFENIFYFDNIGTGSYRVASTLYPGVGYWFMMSEDNELDIIR